MLSVPPLRVSINGACSLWVVVTLLLIIHSPEVAAEVSTGARNCGHTTIVLVPSFFNCHGLLSFTFNYHMHCHWMESRSHNHRLIYRQTYTGLGIHNQSRVVYPVEVTGINRV